jgi:hypothetical protein
MFYFASVCMIQAYIRLTLQLDSPRSYTHANYILLQECSHLAAIFPFGIHSTFPHSNASGKYRMPVLKKVRCRRRLSPPESKSACYCQSGLSRASLPLWRIISLTLTRTVDNTKQLTYNSCTDRTIIPFKYFIAYQILNSHQYLPPYNGAGILLQAVTISL